MTAERYMEIFSDEELRNKTNVRWGDKEIKFPRQCEWFNNILFFYYGTTRYRVEELEEFVMTEAEKYVEVKEYIVAVEREMERGNEIFQREFTALEERISMLED